MEDDNIVSRDETFSSDMCVYGFVSVDDCTYGCIHMVVKTSAPIFGEMRRILVSALVVTKSRTFQMFEVPNISTAVRLCTGPIIATIYEEIICSYGVEWKK